MREIVRLFGNCLLVILGCLSVSAAIASDLAGYWKLAEQPAWIEISFGSGSGRGTVLRNDNKPEAVGRVLLKDVVNDKDNPGSWRGQIYAERLGEYKDAEISLPEPDHMQIKVSVGFMSRTVTWTRSAALSNDQPAD